MAGRPDCVVRITRRMTSSLSNGMATAERLVGEVLEHYPELLPTFLAHGFSMLSNPQLRRTMARVVTLGQACRRLDVDLDEFLAELNRQIAATFRTNSISAVGSAWHTLTPQSLNTSANIDSREEIRSMSFRKLWVGFVRSGGCIVRRPGVLRPGDLSAGPPLPERVVTTEGEAVLPGEQIKDGQNVWQSIGGQEIGSVWGHGAYVAPDWSADWLHREATWLLDHWASARARRNPMTSWMPKPRPHFAPGCRRSCAPTPMIPQTGDLDDLAAAGRRPSPPSATTTPRCSATIPSLSELREAYAIPANSLKTASGRSSITGVLLLGVLGLRHQPPGQRDHLHATTGRPKRWSATCPPASIVVWSVISFVLLLAGIGALAWYFAVQARVTARSTPNIRRADPLLASQADALDAGHAQVFLGRGGTDGRAGGPGRRHGPLRRGRRGLLRHSAWPSGCRTP